MLFGPHRAFGCSTSWGPQETMAVLISQVSSSSNASMAAAHQSWNCVSKRVLRSQDKQTARMQVRQNSGKIPRVSCYSYCAAGAQHPRHPTWVFGRASLPSTPPSHPPRVTAVIGGTSCWQQRSTSCQNRTGRGAGHQVGQRGAHRAPRTKPEWRR